MAIFNSFLYVYQRVSSIYHRKHTGSTQQLLENSKTYPKRVPGGIPRKDAERQIRELRAHLVGNVVGGLVKKTMDFGGGS